jgi:hypothetical protein
MPALDDPLWVLEQVAGETSGALIRDGQHLDQYLKRLKRRIRITYQFSGAADGSLQPLEVAYGRRGARARHPLWARSGTPSALPQARVRRIIAGHDLGAESDLEVDLALGAQPGERELRILAETEAPGALEAGTLRLTLAAWDGESPPRVWEESRTLRGHRPWQDRLTVRVSEEEEWLAVVVDQPATGRWSSTGLIELHDQF